MDVIFYTCNRLSDEIVQLRSLQSTCPLFLPFADPGITRNSLLAWAKTAQHLDAYRINNFLSIVAINIDKLTGPRT